MSKYITFRLGAESYAVGVESVQSIERMLLVTRVPGVRSFVLGVTNLRGVVTPVVNPKILFGSNEATVTTEETRIVVLNYEGVSVGLVVDSANTVIDISESDIQSMPEVGGGLQNEFLKGIVIHEETTFGVLELSMLLASKQAIAK